MARVYNFSAGPATLPEAVLEQVREELLDYRGSGMSVMEMSHRDRAFTAIAEQAEADLRALLGVPSRYRVLFMQGGATAQFSLVPMQLARGRTRADYVLTGSWSRKAAREAARYLDVHIAAEGEHAVPPRAQWRLSADAAYVHYTPNETIDGVEFHWLPDVGDLPLVADFSSSFLSRPIDVSRFGLIYAGAQKNAGPAGVTIVLVDGELLDEPHAALPSVFNYRSVADHASMLNTPPCFAWYVCGLVFRWLLEQGGLAEMAGRNRRKANLLYHYLDGQDFYHCPVAPADRSWMNVVFRLPEPALDAAFLQGATAAGLDGLQGHRLVGGMRASLYNAFPEAGVHLLIDYLREFARRA
ncbi:MAG: 3-phosphoserine/phosphohydroxythreonine transaminase [Gammaproteobacteria bacterium]|nr:3-phosphoserine/phosphohydroxythreonine transaminase [Gammaproteobacteria bacterium]